MTSDQERLWTNVGDDCVLHDGWAVPYGWDFVNYYVAKSQP